MNDLPIDEKTLREELTKLREFLAQPNSYADDDFANKSRRAAELENLLAKIDELAKLSRNLADDEAIVKNSAKDPENSNDENNENDELAELAKSEIPELTAKIAKLRETKSVKFTACHPGLVSGSSKK